MALGSRVEFDLPALEILLESPGGPVDREVQRVAGGPVLQLAREELSRPWPGPPGPFPPPGPPYLRTGDLRDSLAITSTPGPGGRTDWVVIPTAIHRGVNYGEILLGRGYRFLPPAFYT